MEDTVKNGQGENVTDNTTMNPLCVHNDKCWNDSDYFDFMYSDMFPEPNEWVLIFVYTIVFITGLVGNILVCCVIWRNRSMRTVTNIFIVNLSIADIAVLVMCLPMNLLVDITYTWFFGTVMCKINQFTMVSSTLSH